MGQVVSRKSELDQLEQVPVLSEKEAKEWIPKFTEASLELWRGVGHFQSWMQDLQLQYPDSLSGETKEFLEDIFDGIDNDEQGEDELATCHVNNTMAA